MVFRSMAEMALKRSYPGLFYDLARGKHTFLSLSQPALGAIVAGAALPQARVMILGLAAATAGYFAVYSLNDVLDRRVDRESLRYGKSERDINDIGVAVRKHPLAWGDVSLKASLAWIGSLGLVSAAIAFLLSPVCLLAFAGCVALETFYCALRRVTWMKTFVSGAMVGLGALAGWLAVAPLNRDAVYLFFFLALWEIYGRNLSNDLADLASDSRVGIRTVATAFGNRVSAWSILVGAAVTVGFTLIMPLPALSRIILAATGVIWMLIPALELAANPTSGQSSVFFNKASYYPTLALLAMLPLVL